MNHNSRGFRIARPESLNVRIMKFLLSVSVLRCASDEHRCAMCLTPPRNRAIATMRLSDFAVGLIWLAVRPQGAPAV